MVPTPTLLASAGIAVQLAEQGIAIFFGPVGQVRDEVFHLFTGGIAKSLHAAEIGGIALTRLGSS